MNKENRYKFIVCENKVICITHYAGKEVKAIAKCNPGDVFDVDFGKKLAKARCDYKVAIKRLKRASNERDYVMRELMFWSWQQKDTEEYFCSAKTKLEEAEATLNSVEAEGNFDTVK